MLELERILGFSSTIFLFSRKENKSPEVKRLPKGPPADLESEPRSPHFYFTVLYVAF